MDSHSTSDKNDPKLIHNSNETALNSDSMASAHNNSSSKKLSATSSNDNEDNVQNMDDIQLKALLDEAITYRNPRDVEDKSDTFKKLLKSTTEEDEIEKFNMFRTLLSNKKRSSHRHQHGGSLQDLTEAISNSDFGTSSTYGSNHTGGIYNHTTASYTSKKQNRSNNRKNSTNSVSTRQREGGSLPSNVNQSVIVQPVAPFLQDLEYKYNKKGHLEHTIIDMGMINDGDRKYLITGHIDPKADGISASSMHPSEGLEMKYFKNYTNSMDFELSSNGDVKSAKTKSTPSSSITTMSSITSSGSTSITTPAMTGPKVTATSPASSIAISSISSSASCATATSAINDVDDKIKMSFLESFQQKQQIIVDGSTINHSNHTVLANSNLNFGTVGGGSTMAKNAVDSAPLRLNPDYNSVLSLANGGYKPYGKNAQLISHQDETCHITGALLQTPPIMMTQAATTGSVLSTTLKDAKSKKRSIPKGERNVRTIEAQSIKGYRGEDNLDDLLNYIDPKPKNGIVGTNNNSNSNDHANLLEDKKKKLPTKNKGEKVNKLKKCNSMEELRSSPLSKASSITTPPNKIDHDVTLRSKSIHNNSNVTTTTVGTNKKNVTSGGGGVDKVQQPQNKRNERRSWGTEGLNYLSEQANDLQREREKMENESEIIADFVKINDNDDKLIQMSLPPASGTGTSVMDIENVDSSNSSNNGMDMELDSISIEPQTADFCVVQKKRKVKRKSDERGDYGERNNRMLSSYGNNNNNNNNNNNSNNNNKRDQVMNNRGTRNNSYNDRGDAKQSRVAKNSSDAKVHTGGAKSRRKSASSMPPSDKSDDSDVDSVQSLPMETTKSFLNSSHGAHSNANGQEHISNNNNNNNNTNNNNNNNNYNNNTKKSNKNQQNHQQQQSKSQISYADIAKSINNNKNKLDAIGKSGINSNNNNPSTDKWPSVSSSLSSSAATNNQINNNNTTSSNINNSNNNNKSDSQFPFALPQLALQSPAPITTAAATLAAQPPQTIIDSNQQQNQKKSSAISNKLSFPELVETNNTKNKLLNNVNCVNNNSDTSTTTLSDVTNNNNNNTNNVDQTASSGSHYDVKPMMINYDSNNNNNNNNNDYIHQITPTTITTLSSTTTTATSKKNTISYSQTLLVDHVEQLDPNGNVEELSSIPTTNTNRMGLIKSKSVDHNNFNIDQYPSLEKTLGKSAKKMPLADVLKPVTTLRVMPLEVTTNKKVKQITHPKLLQKVEQTKDENIKRTKKDKAGSDKTLLKKSNVLVQTQQQQQLQNPVNYRPAVIILNDATDQKAIEDESDFGITFGFDINEHLLHDHPASVHESTATTIVGINDNISLENNKNNNNCDIIDNKLFTSTLLINNNNSGAVSGGGGPSENHHNHHLVSPNQTAAPQLQFIVPLSNNQSSTTIIEKNNHHQQHLMNCKENVLDSSTQSSNDLGYISTAGSTPPTQKSMSNDDDLQKVDRQFLNFNESAGGGVGGDEECKGGQLMATCSQIEAQMDENCVPMMILPVFIPPEQTVQYNQEGVVSFVLEEWSKIKNSTMFNGH